MDDGYLGIGAIFGLLAFLAAWIGATMAYGALGFLLGWIPAFVIAGLATVLWPLIVLGGIILALALFG